MQIRSVDSFFCLSVVVFIFAAGCDSRPTRVPISGKVLIDGEPLKYGAVEFVPDKGRQSTGIIDSNGNFKLTCFEPGDGALIGTHHVQVLANEGINTTTTKWHAPKKYADRRTSELVEAITGPTDSLVINLTWKGSTPGKPFVEREEVDPGDEAFAKRRRKK